MSVFFNDDYVAAEHAFDTTRKAGWIADALRAGRLPKVELVDPAGHVPLAEQAIESIHTAEYVEALRTGEPDAPAVARGAATKVKPSRGNASREARFSTIRTPASSKSRWAGNAASPGRSTGGAVWASGTRWCTRRATSPPIILSVKTGRRKLCCSHDATGMSTTISRGSASISAASWKIYN